MGIVGGWFYLQYRQHSHRRQQRPGQREAHSSPWSECAERQQMLSDQVGLNLSETDTRQNHKPGSCATYLELCERYWHHVAAALLCVDERAGIRGDPCLSGDESVERGHIAAVNLALCGWWSVHCCFRCSLALPPSLKPPHHPSPESQMMAHYSPTQNDIIPPSPSSCTPKLLRKPSTRQGTAEEELFA